jgi:ATP-binding cassette subfamily B protein
MTHPLLQHHPGFRHIARAFRLPVLVAAALMSSAALLALGVPVALKNLVEAYRAGGAYLPWVLAGAGLLVGAVVLQAVGRLRTTVVSERLKARYRLHLYDKLMRRSMAFHREHGPGDLMSAIYADLEQMSALHTSLLPSGVASALIILGAGFALARLDPALAAILSLAAAAAFLMSRLVFSQFRSMGRDLQERYSHIYRAVSETFRQALVIKSHRLTGWAGRRYRDKLDNVIDLSVRLQFFHGLQSLLVQVILAAALLVGWVLLSQSSSIDGLGVQLSTLLYGLLLVRQVGAMAGLVARYRQAQGAMDRLGDLLGEADSAAEGRLTRLPALDALEIDGLDFHYGQRQVLDRVSLALRAGERIALIGPNGAGKTTLLNVLVRLERAPRGTVTWNGTDLCDLDADAIRQRVAYLPQDSLLTQATIAENLRMGKLDATEAELWRAAERAGIAPAIRGQEHGMDTLLGSEGSRLSGGEKRRLALARLLIREDADLYLLDEPTEGLDPESERDILATALRALQGKTVILVTHRPAVLDFADRVLRMDNGRLQDVSDPAGKRRNPHPAAHPPAPRAR